MKQKKWMIQISPETDESVIQKFIDLVDQAIIANKKITFCYNVWLVKEDNCDLIIDKCLANLFKHIRTKYPDLTIHADPYESGEVTSPIFGQVFSFKKKQKNRPKRRTFSPIEEDDDVMTLKDWMDDVDRMYFIDDDGWGDLATATEKSNLCISPSEAHSMRIPKWATHIVWYNR